MSEEGWTFKGWDKQVGALITANTTITASWEEVPKTATITYVSEHGTCPQSKTVQKGYALTSTDLPWLTETNYTFTGWDKNNGDVINEDTAITGSWIDYELPDPIDEYRELPKPPRLRGIVSTNYGKPLENATVRIICNGHEYEVKTDADGSYELGNKLSNVLYEGTWNVTAYYPDDAKYSTQTFDVTLSYDTITVQNFILVNPNTDVKVYQIAEGSMYSIDFPNLLSSLTTKTQICYAIVPHGALAPGDFILWTSYGTYEDSKSNNTLPLIVCKIVTSSGSGATPSAPITINISCLTEPKYVLHNGKTIEDYKYVYDEKTGYYILSFETMELSTTEFYFQAEKIDGQTSQSRIAFSPSEFTGYRTNIKTTYSLKNGSTIHNTDTYLAQYVALLEGKSSPTSLTSTAIIGENIYRGIKKYIEGNQKMLYSKYIIGGVEIPITHFGNVCYTFKDRIH